MSKNRIEELKQGAELDQGEIDLYFWQYKKLGRFKEHLFKTISKADTVNLNKLKKGFPEQVDAYRNYSNTNGYWEYVKLKMEK